MASRLITIRAGESIFIDFLKQGETIDATMEASYELIDSLGAVLTSGALTKSADLYTFELRVGSTSTDSLEVADYELLVKVYDSSTGYADFIFEDVVRVYD